jgi:pimeloyl-ACP methyl ester carboxylesterase
MFTNSILVDEKEFFYRSNQNFDKPILLVLHGWNTVGSGSWENFIDEIKDYNIVAPDMPGFGKSVSPGEVWLAKEYGIWLGKFLINLQNESSNFTQKQNLEKPINLLGHSFGGGVATVFAANFPKKVNKLILVAPAIIRRPLSKKQKIIQSISKIGKNTFAKIPLLKKIWYKFLGSGDYEKSNGIMKEIMQKVLRQDLQSYLSNLKLPVLLCWGNLDKYTPFSDSKIVQTQISNCKLVTFENINHGIHLYASQKLAKEVEEFLE